MPSNNTILSEVEKHGEKAVYAGNVAAEKTDKKLQKFDNKFNITEKTKKVDEKFRLTETSTKLTLKINEWEKKLVQKWHDRK